MRLETISYSQFEGEPQSWELAKVQFGRINLLVGLNAAGKTRTLNVIAGIAKLLSGRLPLTFESGRYEMRISSGDSDSTPLDYSLAYRAREVTFEQLVEGNLIRLERGADSEGTLAFEDVKEPLAFRIPKNQLAALNKRDSIQHPYLEALNEWATCVNHLRFAKEVHAVSSAASNFPMEAITQLDPMSNMGSAVIAGEKEYGSAFTDFVVEKMNEIGYPVETLGLLEMQAQSAEGVKVSTPLRMVYVKERDLQCVTNQFEMSQGMYRALSALVHLRLALLRNTSVSLLIDDIGEGLDFERASKLISILVTTAEHSGVQLIMTTNDRFVMNRVPLDYWSVVLRQGCDVRVVNKNSHPKIFDEFRESGLSNFDFFARKAFLESES